MRSSLIAAASLAFAMPAAFAAAAPGGYAILVSSGTLAKPEWKAVVDKLASKHTALSPRVLVWNGSPDTALPELKKWMPRYTCLVATPEEAGLDFVLKVNRFTRDYDADPYTDTFWGILTGFDAQNALEIASEEKPLVVHHVGSGTELALDRCESGTCYSELDKGKVVSKKDGGDITPGKGPDDSTFALADLLASGNTDLWVTSGHATEHGWQIGFRYKNGFFKAKGGQLYGEDTKGGVQNVISTNPKIFLPVGNCLIGHIDGPEAMALAYMKSATVRQMAGYIQPTWYGYQGWGMLDYFVEQPGRYNMNEAWRANNQALVNRIETYFPGSGNIEQARIEDGTVKPEIGEKAKSAGLTAMDLQGLLYDRDHVAFYGDPAWDARMAEGKLNWDQTCTQSAGSYSLTVTPKLNSKTYAPVNLNGSQRGGRPIIQFLDQRIDPGTVKITAGAEWHPLITDDFILVPLPAADSDKEVKIEFTASPAG